MATSFVRKKRNFKGLGLNANALAPPPPPEPEPLPIIGPSFMPTRPAPIPGSKASAAATTAEGNGDASAVAGGSGIVAPAPTPATGITPVVTPGPVGKKKRPGPLSLGNKSVGGSGAQQREDAAAMNGNGVPVPVAKTVLDESGMLTIPAPSSAPVTATMGSASPFRWVLTV
jgi:hypothetical protein